MTKRRSKHLLPGFGLTLGVSMLYITIIIALPLFAMLLKVAGMGWPEFWRIVASPRSLAAYRITFSSALIATVFNGDLGRVALSRNGPRLKAGVTPSVWDVPASIWHS